MPTIRAMHRRASPPAGTRTGSAAAMPAAALLLGLLLAGGPGAPAPAAACCGAGGGLSYASAAFTAFDLADAGLDYAFAAELSAKGFKKEAAWMGVQATLALSVELFVKLPLTRRKNSNVELGGGLDVDEAYGRTMFVLAASMVEVGVFLLEDATTILIWWRTGTFDAGSWVSVANMVFTLVCAGSLLLAMVGALTQVYKLQGQV